MNKFKQTIELKFCPKCHNELRRLHRKKNAPIKPHQQYIYTQYDYCTKCGYLQHYEQYKVLLNPPKEEPKKPKEKNHHFYKSHTAQPTKEQHKPSPIFITHEKNIGPDDETDLPWYESLKDRLNSL